MQGLPPTPPPRLPTPPPPYLRIDPNERPQIPPISSYNIPLDKLPPLIPWGTLITYLFPFCNLSFGPDLAPFEHMPLRWASWLESWYHSFEPTVWVLLKADDEREQEVYRELAEYVSQWRAAYGEDEEYRSVRKEMKGLAMRMHARMSRLYALHIARQQHLQIKRLQYPGFTERTILGMLENDPTVRLSPHSCGSVWPVFVDHPRGKNCPCKLHLSPTEWTKPPTRTQHILPNAPSDLARTLTDELLGTDFEVTFNPAWPTRKEKKEEKRPVEWWCFASASVGLARYFEGAVSTASRLCCFSRGREGYVEIV